MKTRYIPIILWFLIPSLMYGQEAKISAEEKVLIREHVQNLITDFGNYANFSPGIWEQPFDSIYVRKFISLFQDINQDKIVKFFEPGHPLDVNDSAQKIEYYTVKQYVDSLFSWFSDGVEFEIRSEVVHSTINNGSGIYKGYLVTDPVVSVHFMGVRTMPDGSTYESQFNGELKLTIAMTAKHTKKGERAGKTVRITIPSIYKIRNIEVIRPFGPLPEPEMKNMWGFLNIGFMGGYGNYSGEVKLPGFNDMEIYNGPAFGANLEFNIFFNDTSIHNWSFGPGIGIGNNQQTSYFRLANYSGQFAENYSPLNELYLGDYSREITINNAEQKHLISTLQIPLKFNAYRHFKKSKSAIYFTVGAILSIPISDDYSFTAGTLSERGLSCTFEENGHMIENVTLEDLPYYGFGTYHTKKTESPAIQLKSYFINGYVDFGYQWRTHNKKTFIKAGPFAYFGVTNMLEDQHIETKELFSPEGKIANFGLAYSSLMPYVVGINLAISLNIIPNKPKYTITKITDFQAIEED